jgi:RsiW-degrading membrane proteinase PrsW (M82 family)
MIIVVALGIALIIPVIFLFILRQFDLYGTGKYPFNFLTLLCGALAYVLASKINPYMVNAGWVNHNQVIRITAPIVEEILKSLVLIYLVQRADFNYVVDGAIYGFGAGIGFAIIENIEYVTGHSTIALSIALARVFSTNLVHATASGVIGTSLAFRRGDSTWRGWLFTVSGYAVSMLLHMGFNTMVSSGNSIIFAIAVGLIGVGFIYFTIRQGMKKQKTWLVEKLDGGSRVTKNEVKALSTIEKFDDLLKPIADQFGHEKVNKVKTMLGKQAEIGIKLKLLDSTPSEAKRAEINEVINELRSDMEILRKEIGSYCMMFVRTVYMDADIKIWDVINLRIAESNTGQKGGGMFDRLTERVKSSNAPQEDSHGS